MGSRATSGGAAAEDALRRPGEERAAGQGLFPPVLNVWNVGLKITERGSGGVLSGGQLLPDWVSGTRPLSSGGEWAEAPPLPSPQGEAGILGPLSGQADSLLDVRYLQCPLLERERARRHTGTEAGAGEGIEGVSCTSQSTKLG